MHSEGRQSEDFKRFYQFVGELCKKAKEGSFERFYFSYLKGEITLKELGERALPFFAKVIAKEVINTRNYYGLSDEFLMDLFNEAVVAFMDALSKYKPEKGVKFVTYLVKAIRRRLVRFILMKMHLVRDKSYLHSSNTNNEKQKFEYERITDEEVQRYLMFRLSYQVEDVICIDKEKIRETIEKIGDPKIKKILLKMLEEKKLTNEEKRYFYRKKESLKNFFKGFGIYSVDDIRF